MNQSFRHIIRVGLFCLIANARLLADVPSLVNELSSSDLNERRAAVGGLLRIASQTMPVIATTTADASGLTTPEVKAALFEATNDSDAAVREAALETYAFTFKLTPALENKIIAEFNSSASELPHQPSNRPALMEMLMIGGSPSPNATAFLTNLLDNPKWAPHVATRIATDNCPLSGSALDKLALKLAQEKDAGNRATYARAIGAYRQNAQQYRPQLQAALASETDEVTKQNLQRAIAATQ